MFVKIRRKIDKDLCLYCYKVVIVEVELLIGLFIDECR